MVARTLPFKSRDKPKPNKELPSITEEIHRQIEADQNDIKETAQARTTAVGPD